jgi:lipopolysaccharide transport system ATP-binding protein
MPLAIKVENLSKQYRLGQIGTGTLSHDLNRFWASIRGKEDPYAQVGTANDRTQKAVSDYVWALKDINFEIEQGDAVGIIGRNGAGKSTLLKILSRTTLPTTGSVKMKGRIASLLEVGTGFHPEMTGRENIYQNGAILGMTRHEITRKFDEIVDFSGCEAYIDTPVKRYSSGMYVRLAFAVAAHLESEILIVDEVLAVGDAEFQKKCLGKMNDVAKGEGRTVLFVSHNMAAVKSLCNKGIVLKDGSLAFKGSQEEATSYYQKNMVDFKTTDFSSNADMAPGNASIKVLGFDVNPIIGDVIQISSGVKFELIFLNYCEGINLDITFELKTLDDVPIFHHGTLITSKKDSRKGMYKVVGSIPENLLNSGNYKFKLIFGQDQRIALFILEDVIQFEIMNETSGSNSSILPGIIRPNIKYSIDLKM